MVRYKSEKPLFILAWVGFVKTYPLILLGESLKSEHPFKIVNDQDIQR